MKGSSTYLVLFMLALASALPQNTPKPTEQPNKVDLTTQVPTTLKTEIRIQTLPNDDSKSIRKELDNPSKIIDMHKSDDDDAKDIKTHEVSGRKGVEPSADVVTEITNDHVQDLKDLVATSTTTTTSPPITTTTTTTTTTQTTTVKTTTSKTASPKKIHIDEVDNTPRTSLLVGVILGCILLSVVVFVGFKRLDAIRRRREYRRMNDFLIDGMYNEM